MLFVQPIFAEMVCSYCESINLLTLLITSLLCDVLPLHYRSRRPPCCTLLYGVIGITRSPGRGGTAGAMGARITETLSEACAMGTAPLQALTGPWYDKYTTVTHIQGHVKTEARVRGEIRAGVSRGCAMKQAPLQLLLTTLGSNTLTAYKCC